MNEADAIPAQELHKMGMHKYFKEEEGASEQ